MNIQEILEYDYQEWKSNVKRQGYSEESFNNCYSVYNYLADNVFNICTYENIVAMEMAKDFLIVATAITKQETFELVAQQPQLYLRTINYDFFTDKISWGSSIRGAWWDFDEEITLMTTNVGNITATYHTINDFVSQLNIFVKNKGSSL